MSSVRLFCLGLALAAASADEAVIFHADFEAPDALAGWPGGAGRVVEGYQGSKSLLIEQPAGEKIGSVTRTIRIPAERLAGQRITLEAAVRAEEVSERPKSWNGIKVMLILEFAEGKQYPQLPLPVGTFDWTPVARSIRVPRDLTGATLVLGLEQVSGKAWFDEVVIRLGPPRRAAGRRSEVMFTGHDVARLRGAMHGPTYRAEDLRTLATEWGMNHIRWQLNWVPMNRATEWAKDLEAYDKWLDGALVECDQALADCEKYGVKVLVDLHCPPGGRAEAGVCRMFAEQRYQDKLIEVWDRIARRYQGREVIWAYDLINEPVEGQVAPGLLRWRELATKAAQTIRAVDPGKPVVFEPGPWGGPGGFDDLVPLDLERVIYSFHMYLPHSFTHQGVHGSAIGLAYPGVIEGIGWDKERLREAMQPARDFQEAYNVQMYVGEFSAIRWAPDGSAYRYLKDLIEIFEEYGWDWAYHAFREWSGWSVEHAGAMGDDSRSPTPTEREQLLRSWYAKNERPH